MIGIANIATQKEALVSDLSMYEREHPFTESLLRKTNKRRFKAPLIPLIYGTHEKRGVMMYLHKKGTISKGNS